MEEHSQNSTQPRAKVRVSDGKEEQMYSDIFSRIPLYSYRLI
jgi:hypothetical protein